MQNEKLIKGHKSHLLWVKAVENGIMGVKQVHVSLG